MGKVRLKLLGGFRLHRDNAAPAIVRVSARKSMALLAYVALHPERRVGRAVLATLLWADRPDRQARHSLRQCLVSLRAELAEAAPDLLVVQDDDVALNLSAEAIDAVTLDTLAGSSSLADLAHAASLHRGAFLADLDIGVEPFDDWASTERTRLEAVTARVLEALATGLDDAGDGDGAIEAAGRLVALDPLREDWQRLRLRLVAGHRGRDAALAEAEVLTTLLQRDLGVAPSALTLSLIEEIEHSQTPSPGPVVVGSEPVPRGVTATAHGWARLGPALAVAAAVVLGASGWMALRWVQSADSGSTSDEIMLAVLPFTTVEKGGEFAAATNKMTANLIAHLANAPQVGAISPQASGVYRDSTVDIARIGSDLGAQYIVEGQLERTGDRFVVRATLSSSHTRAQVASERWEESWNDRDAAMERIARELERSLNVDAVDAEAAWASRQRDPGVRGLLAQGWAAILRHNAVNTTGEAEAFFQQVLAREPHNVRALVGVGASNAAAVANLYVATEEPYLTRAETALEEAITLAPRSAGAFYWLGITQLVRHRFEDAARSFDKAATLNPDMAMAFAQSGYMEGMRGRPDEGLAKIRHAIDLSPKDPAVGRWYLFAGQIELERGRFEAAVAWLSRSVEEMPRFLRARMSLAAAYAELGHMKAASAEVETIRRLMPAGFDANGASTLSHLSNSAGLTSPRLLEGWRLAAGAS